MAVTFPRVLQRLAPAGGALAGREKEMDALRRAWADAAEGVGGAVFLAGEAGMGKTRLAAELAGEVDAAGGCVLIGTCPACGAEPFQPLVDALGPLPTGERDRDAMLDTLAAGVIARARRAPVLLLLDDVHRADRSTLLAVRRIVEKGDGEPLLVVATYRDTALDRSHPLTELLGALLPLAGVERISVEGLTPAAVTEMVGDGELGRRLWRQSAGNPVRVAELLRPGALDASLPTEFDELVTRRVARLSSTARAFLQAAAVAGSEFSVEVAADAAGLSGGRAAEALKQVAAAGFVVEEPVGPGDTRRFVHEMVRDAVEHALSPTARVALHRQIGRALEKSGAGRSGSAALLAWHYRAAAPVGLSGRVLFHAAAAGDRAMELLAWDEAAFHYGQALAAAVRAGDAVKADLLLALGEAQRLAGEGARARQAFFEAAGLARAAADGPRMARAALALGQLDAVWGADPELEAVARTARSLLGAEALPTTSLPTADDFASATLYDMLESGPPSAPSPSRSPARPAPAAGTGRSEAVALLRARHVALAGPEHAADRLETAEAAVALAQETGDDELLATANRWRLVDAMEAGRHDVAARAEAAHAAIARRLQVPRVVADAASWTAMRALLEGRADDARLAAANAYDMAVGAGDPEADDSYLLHRWWWALEWGSDDDLAEMTEECRLAAGTNAGGRRWRAALALTLARSGRMDLAAEELRRVTDHGLGELVRDPGRLHPLTCLVETAWLVGDAYRATSVGELLAPYAGHGVVATRAVLCRGSVARACGMAAVSAQRWDEAERHYRSALAVHRDMGAKPLLARTRWEWSAALVARGRLSDRRKAADHRRKATELAKELGMTRLLEEIGAQ